MQRLDGEPHAGGLRVRENRLDAGRDHRPGIRQTRAFSGSGHEHQHGRSDRGRFVDRAEIVLDADLAFGRARRREESAATQTRHAQPGGAKVARGSSRTVFGEFIAPHGHGRNTMPHATVDRLAQRPRLDGVLIEREAGAVHQTMPASASTRAMRSAARS